MTNFPRYIACLNDSGELLKHRTYDEVDSILEAMKEKNVIENISDEESYNNWEEFNEEYPDDWEAMDGDHDSAMESAGWGTDEDYGYYGEDF